MAAEARTLLAASLLAITSGAHAQTASAETYPARPVRFIVPFTPGGNTDVQGRLIAQKLSAMWGQQVVVDNRPGAGGTLGVETTARANPDGYTLVLASFGNILVGPALYKKLPYDPLKDLSPVVLVSTPPGLLVVNPALPVKSVKDLIAHSRANPGKLNYASSGNGTWNHLFAELFKSMAKIDMAHVPYKGAVPAVTDLISGLVQVNMAPFPAALPQVKAGRLRALAVTSDRRSPVLADLPTVAESGLPRYEAVGWFAMLAPPKTPRAIVSKVNADVNRIFGEADVKAAFAADGTEPAGGSPADLEKSMREGVAKWGRLVRDLGVTL